jgi:DNA-binding MarR family transcriptional regulator
VRKVLITAREFERRFDGCLAEHGLNLTRAEVLSSIGRHGESGCSQTALAAQLKLSESNICTLVERMQTDGWLFRLRSGVDRRRSVIVLSPRGLDALAQIERIRQRRAAAWLRGLTARELNSLNQLLDRLLQSLHPSELEQEGNDAQPPAAPASRPGRTFRRAS